MSLRRTVTRSSLAIGLTGALATAAVVQFAAQRTFADQVRGRIANIGQNRAHAFDGWIEEGLDEIIIAASETEVVEAVSILADRPSDEDALARLGERLGRRLAIDRHFIEFVVDRVGDSRVLFSTRPEAIGSYEPSPVYAQQGALGPFVQEVYSSPRDGRPQLTAAAPIIPPGDSVPVAVLAGHLNLDELEERILQVAGSGFPVDIYLVSSSGDFVTAERFGREGGVRGPRSEGIDAAILDRTTGTSEYDDYLGRRVLGDYRWLPERSLGLIVEVPKTDALLPARRLALLALLTAMLASLWIALSARRFARRIAEPLELLAEATGRVEVGQFEAAIPELGGPSGEVLRLRGAFEEMTHRLQASYGELAGQVEATRTALAFAEESRSLLQAIVDNSPSLIGVCSRDGVFRLANRRLLELLGTDPIDRRVEALLPAPLGPMIRTLMAQAIEEDRIVETEFSSEQPGREGEQHYFAVVFPLGIRGGGPEEVGFIALDRSERVRAEAARAALEGRLEHAQKLESLGLLAGGVAHDFNNLLQAILGHISLLEDDLPTEAVESHVEPVMVAAQRAAELTGQLLAYAGRRTLRRQNVSVNTALRQLSELIAVTMPKSATLIQELGEDAGAVEADPAQVSQVLMNLLTNAADALRDGEGTVQIRTRAIRLEGVRAADRPDRAELPDGDYVEIVVEDDGEGMDAPTVERIFEPFFTTKETGRGLGLAAVLGIVRGSGGHLSVRSTPGSGTAFTVLFPRTESPEDPISTEKPELPSLHGSTILVADDEQGVREFVGRALGRAGAEVEMVGDGEAAVEMLRAEPERFDLVVFDLTMPVMGGTDALLHVRRMRPDIPAIISSGYDAADSLEAIERMDGVTFLQKPYRGRTLLRAASEMLQEARQTR